MSHKGLLRWLIVFGFVPIFGQGSAVAQDRRPVVERRGYVQPQAVSLEGNTALLVWARPVGSGHDLLVARREQTGALGDARRVNLQDGSVRVLGIDEARVAVAGDGGRRAGLAWFDVDGRLWAARSEDGGASFVRPVRLDGGAGRPEHAFVHATFDPDGVLHVVWLDARDAPKGMEEPARTFHAALTEHGAVPETDLTGDHFATVCGCCRPYVYADRFGVQVAFRAVDPEGYRDVHRMTRDRDGVWSDPVRVGPPLWKIDGCPMAGPITDGRQVIWRDGSQPLDRIVEGSAELAPVRNVVRLESPRVTLRSPRWVGASDRQLLLVPGTPHGRLLAREGGAWTVLADELPAWCHDALRLGDELLLLGDDQARLELQAFPLRP